MEPIIASNNLETAVVPHTDDLPREEEEEESAESSSESENEDDLPPGPVDPEKCTVGGPGTSGGSAQAPISFHIQARDSRDKKLTEGGDYVVVRVIPGSTALAAGAKESEAIVKDNEDGSYTATYSVEARGDYQLTVEINGSAFGGSPFPVFFSPPDERAAEAAFTDALGAVVDQSTVSAASDAPMPVISILGAAAYKAKVTFPEDKDILARTVIVGEMNPAVNLEQLQKLFSYSGQVQGCVFSGLGKAFAFVTLATPQEAEQALTLDKLLVIDRQIRVEAAAVALDSKGQSGGVQYAALQLEQIQRLRKAQSEQHSLAAQVASMRVQAKQNPTAFAPGLPQNSASQKAAALSAIAALSKRLTGNAHTPAPTREQEPPPKRRREVSPTLRYRRDRRSRSRSRSRSRRRPSPTRRRSPAIILRRSPVRRREERRPSRERRRDSSRDHRHRSRSHSRSRRREDRQTSTHRREGDRTDRHRRSRSRSQGRRRDRKDSDEKERVRSRSQRADSPRRSRREERAESSEKATPIETGKEGGEEGQRSSPAAGLNPGNSKDGAGEGSVPASMINGNKKGNEIDAQALREKALENLHTLRSLDAENELDAIAGPEPEGEHMGEDKKKKRHKSKHHKHGKSRKEKRSRRDDAEPDPQSEEPEPHFSP